MIPSATESLFHIRRFGGPFATEFGVDAGGWGSPITGTICIIALFPRTVASMCAASSSGTIALFHYFAGSHLSLSDQGTLPLAAQFGDGIIGFGLIDASTSVFSQTGLHISATLLPASFMVVLLHSTFGVFEFIASFTGPFAVSFTKTTNPLGTFLQPAGLNNLAASLTTSIVTNRDIVTALLDIIADNRANGVA